MGSKRLFTYMTAFIIVLILTVVLIKTSFHKQANWHETSGEGLHAKIQNGLTQMYWQWQSSGRASHIDYWPDQGHEAFVIEMNREGFPVVARNVDGCSQFLYLFIDKKLLNKSIDVAITFIQPHVNSANTNDKELSSSVATSGPQTAICQFTYAGKFHTYDLNTGQLSFIN